MNCEGYASACGKVLLVGGYVVLDRGQSGLVMSVNARFHATVSHGQRDQCSSVHVRMIAPQYSSTPSCWSLDWSTTLLPSMRPLDGTLHHTFVENCVSYSIGVLSHVLPERYFAEKLDGGIDLYLHADEAFYSQVADSKNCVSTKTGLGSSAALCASLVGALFNYFGVLGCTQNNKVIAHTEYVGEDWLECAHRVAQICHSAAQGKIGSGFDVSAAFFGTQLYGRFTKDLIDDIINGDNKASLLTRTLAARVLPSVCKWNIEREHFFMPPGFILVLGDVQGGSETPSMVRQVVKWRQENSTANSIWTELITLNTKAVSCLQQLCTYARDNPAAYGTVISCFADSSTSHCSQSIPDEKSALIMRTFEECRLNFSQIQRQMSAMGRAAGVDIVPRRQEMLLDASYAVRGVVAAGVPGAGGFDAIFALCVGELAKKELIAAWGSLVEAKATAVDVVEDNRGMVFERATNTVDTK